MASGGEYSINCKSLTPYSKVIGKWHFIVRVDTLRSLRVCYTYPQLPIQKATIGPRSIFNRQEGQYSIGADKRASMKRVEFNAAFPRFSVEKITSIVSLSW